MAADSLNVPVPDRVARLAAGLAADCHTADVRTRHTLVAKRLGDRDGRARPADSVRARLAGDTPPFAARVTGLDAFERPVSGPAPVVYLAVESPELERIHDRLCRAFPPVEGVEADDYVPHVTVARGGDAARLLERSVDPVAWTVERLVVWDAERRAPVETIALPA